MVQVRLLVSRQIYMALSSNRYRTSLSQGGNPSSILGGAAMENICLYCKHFKIWDNDPCCLHKDVWKILLPTETCENHEEETFKPVLRLHAEMWEEVKKEFFKTYIIEDADMVKRYLKHFPDDKDLIQTKKDI